MNKIHKILILLCIIVIIGLITGVIKVTETKEKSEFIRAENKTICSIEKISRECVDLSSDGGCWRYEDSYEKHNLVFLTNTIPTCTCFRIDDTIVTIEDKAMAKVKWDEKEGVNIECCAISIESELQLREDNSWKCRCSFNWNLKVKKIWNETCYNEIYHITNHTFNKCINQDPWGECLKYEWLTETEEIKNKTVFINETIISEEIEKQDTYENIFVHNIMQVGKNE